MTYDCAAELEVTRITFEDRPGLVVRCVPPSFGGECTVDAAVPLLRNSSMSPRLQRKAVLAVVDALGSSVVSWELTRFGKPVPPTPDGLLSLPRGLLLDVVAAWLDSVVYPTPVEVPAVEAPEPDPDLSVLHDIRTVTLPEPVPDGTDSPPEPLEPTGVERPKVLEPVGAGAGPSGGVTDGE